MKRSTAVRHLVEMAAEATSMVPYRGTDIGWPLDELWVCSELLETRGEVEFGGVIVMLDRAAAGPAVSVDRVYLV
jgi:hypothetical protein